VPALAVVAGLSGDGWRDGEEAARALQFAVEWGSRVRLLAAVLDALKGSKAAEIVRPITITKKNDDGEVESTFTRFKFVKVHLRVQPDRGRGAAAGGDVRLGSTRTK
jgi:hypothetical protein